MIKCLNLLGEAFGYEINQKGFKVLPKFVRLIQGDGINQHSIEKILVGVINNGWSIDNIAFGMGGELLQTVNRDTMRFAMKSSAISFDNGKTWEGRCKMPATDPTKASKSGVLGLIENGVNYQTVPKNIAGSYNLLQTVYKDGKILIEDNFNAIRERAKIS